MLANILSLPRAGHCFRAIVLIVLHLIISMLSYAQQPPEPGQKNERDPVSLFQELFPSLSEEANAEELLETLLQYYSNPADLNLAGYDELAALLLFSHEQIHSLLSYRKLTGPFLSLYELQAIPGFDLSFIQQILPFVTLQPRFAPLKQTLKNPTSHFLLLRGKRTLETSKGFSPLDSTSRSTTRYAGNPWQFSARYRYARTGSFSTGFTLEKDPGEVFFWAPRKQALGADFTSFHVQLVNRKYFKNLVVGDFQVQTGQSMILSSGFSLGKGAEVIRSTYRSNLGIRPYTSAMESGFFRGLAVTLGLRPSLDLTVFHARNRRSATIAGTEVITSFPTDGFHRTPTEQAKRGNSLEQNSGLHLLYQPGSLPLKAGLTLLHTRYSLPFEKRNLPYNQYEFRGRQNVVAGLHADYRFRNLHFFTEAARSVSGGAGSVLGAVAAVSKTLDATVLARAYQRNFHTLYGAPFSEASRAINENGLYAGIRYSPSRKWQYSGYMDLFHSPWKRYLVDTTSRGFGYLLHTQWKPSRTFRMYGLLQQEQKQRNNPDSKQPNLPLVTSVRRVAIVNLEWDRPLKYQLRTRIQGGDFRYRGSPPSRGFALAQDVTWRLRPVEISARIALFGTDSYDSRQYVFEKDVLYAFSLPSYYNHGTRHYLMVRYALTRQLRLWLRWAQTRYSDSDAIGSGLDEIMGKHKSEVKMQVMYRF